MGKYDIKIADNSVRVDVLDSAELISSRVVNDLIPKLPKESPVVGLDLHSRKKGRGVRSANSVLVLCIDAYCLVIQLKYVDKISENLKKFLDDKNTCSVSVGVHRKLSRGAPPPLNPLLCKTAVELSHLAWRIRQDSSYCNSDLKALATKDKVSYEPPVSK
ncbi:hypothetical protein Nepgr_029912 [Nepenthes gracilis]|uniref:Uncharacterized protein n=1 Tax=Nepenthes gracilis TaxID=150966 RepID=A0AAD3TF99_NEPGR|nr:hypothetical protein Nepgr_029912 [Nepenthes gracilis]